MLQVSIYYTAIVTLFLIKTRHTSEFYWLIQDIDGEIDIVQVLTVSSVSRTVFLPVGE